MRRFTRLLVFGALIAALVLPIGTVSATSTFVTYGLSGVEYAATVDQGSFVGVARSGREIGVWQAVVNHSEFDATTGDATITGGRFVLHSKVRDIVGDILSGYIEALPTTSGCGKETFKVTGTLALAGGGGSGTFVDVVLTHYRYQTPSGDCITYFATVRGGVTFTFTLP